MSCFGNEPIQTHTHAQAINITLLEICAIQQTEFWRIARAHLSESCFVSKFNYFLFNLRFVILNERLALQLAGIKSSSCVFIWAWFEPTQEKYRIQFEMLPRNVLIVLKINTLLSMRIVSTVRTACNNIWLAQKVWVCLKLHPIYFLLSFLRAQHFPYTNRIRCVFQLAASTIMPCEAVQIWPK